MTNFQKILAIWGGMILIVIILYLKSPMDGSVSLEDNRIFPIALIASIIGTYRVLRNKDKSK